MSESFKNFVPKVKRITELFSTDPSQYVNVELSKYQLSLLAILKKKELTQLTTKSLNIENHYRSNTHLMCDYTGLNKHISVISLIDYHKIQLNDLTESIYSSNIHINSSIYICDDFRAKELIKSTSIPIYYIKDIGALRLIMNDIPNDSLSNNLSLTIKISKKNQKQYHSQNFTGNLRLDILNKFPIIIVNYNIYNIFINIVSKHPSLVFNRVIYDIWNYSVYNHDNKNEGDPYYIINSLKYYIIETYYNIIKLVKPYNVASNIVINNELNMSIKKPFMKLLQTIIPYEECINFNEGNWLERYNKIIDYLVILYDESVISNLFSDSTINYNIIESRTKNNTINLYDHLFDISATTLIKILDIPCKELDDVIIDNTLNEENNIKECTNYIENKLQTTDLSSINLKINMEEDNLQIVEEKLNCLKKLVTAKNKKANLINRLSISECCICKDEIKEPAITTCCYNKFCLKCIVKGVVSCNFKCPYCRAPINLDKYNASERINNVIYVNNKQFYSIELLIEESKLFKSLDNIERIINYIKTKKKYKIYIIVNLSMINYKLLQNKLTDLSIRYGVLDEDFDEFISSSWLNCFIRYRLHNNDLNHTKTNNITDIINLNSSENIHKNQLEEKLFKIGKETNYWLFE